jgi:nitrate reductase NapE component
MQLIIIIKLIIIFIDNKKLCISKGKKCTKSRNKANIISFLLLFINFFSILFYVFIEVFYVICDQIN